MTNSPGGPLWGPSSFAVCASVKALLSLHGFSALGTPLPAPRDVWLRAGDGRTQPGLEGCELPGSPALDAAALAGAAGMGLRG